VAFVAFVSFVFWAAVNVTDESKKDATRAMLIVSPFLPTRIEFSFMVSVADTAVSLGNRRLRRALYHGLPEAAKEFRIAN
jgi:hypothetical protein